jgi:prefoldin subunit 5
VILESQHKDHEILKLKQVYDRHCDQIRQESNELRKRLKDLSSGMKDVQTCIDSVQKCKDDRSREIETFVENLQTKLNGQLKTKLLNLVN